MVEKLRAAIVSQSGFRATVWVCLIVAFLFVVMRTWVRLKVFKRIMDDDVFVFIAITMLFITAILWQWFLSDMYELLDLSSGIIAFPPPTFIEDVTRYLRASLGIILLYNSALWSVKFSFLLFFRRLGQNVRGIKTQWWCTFAFTVVTYIVIIATVQFRCLVWDLSYIITECVKSDAIIFQRATLINNCIMDVLTDIAIVAIPIRMLWNVKIDIRQKIALASIFLLVVITMAFSIIRTIAVALGSNQPEESWLYFWNLIEITIAIIIVCLSSFRTLFTKQTATSTSQRSLMRGLFGSWKPWSSRGSRSNRSRHSEWTGSNDTRGIRLQESFSSISSPSREKIVRPDDARIRAPTSTYI